MLKNRSLQIFFGSLVTALLVVSFSAMARSELPEELPEKFRFVGIFDYRKSQDEALLAGLQQMLLFAAEADQLLRPLADSFKTAGKSGIERVVVVQLSGQDEVRTWAALRFRTGKARLAGLSAINAIANSDAENTVGYVKQGEKTLILGHQESIHNFGDGLTEQVLEVAENQLEDENQTAWVWMSPGWFKASAKPELADKSWSIAGALSNIQGAVLELWEGTPPELSWDIHAGSNSDAALLMDDLQSSMRAAQSGNGQRLITEMLQSALVRRDSNVTSLHLTPEIAALELLAESQAARGLLTWRTGAASRESDDRLADLFQRMDLSPGDSVADIGAGRGFLTVRLASIVGESGRVYAVEISEESLEHLSSRKSASGLDQIRIVEGAIDDPRLPEASLDAVIIINSYHEMTEYESMLRHIRESLQEGGRLVILDSYSQARKAQSREAQTEEHEISPDLIQKDLQSAGFEVIVRDDGFIDRDHGDHRHLNALIVARKPDLASGTGSQALGTGNWEFRFP